MRGTLVFEKLLRCFLVPLGIKTIFEFCVLKVEFLLKLNIKKYLNIISSDISPRVLFLLIKKNI